MLLRAAVSVFLVLFYQAGFCQIDSAIATYDEQFPKEKIHIHFDKSVYNKEETIWYKVYVLMNTDWTTVSRNIYVEWYDTTGRMIKQTVAPLFQSSAKGAFELPADYRGSFIHVKAYTRWMLNDDPAFSYERDLSINFNAAVSAKKPVIINRTKLELFPEGGYVIPGIESRIAFKAANQFGNPVMVKALLVNSKNKTLDTLHIEHDGMGSFQLQAQPGESYKVNWTDEFGRTGSTPVDISKTEGAAMNIATTNDKAIVQVERTAGAAGNFRHMNLLVHMNQKLYFKVSLPLTDKASQQARIPIDELPTGLLQFSLFTADWVPVAERIIFVNNHQHEFNARLIPQLVNMEKRGKNVIDIQVSDTAMSNMSVSITDANVPIPEADNIYTDFLLSDEIKGKVYNPAYYLKSDADSITRHLDLVMLTNGWRRFDWDKIRAGARPVLQYPVETDMMKIGGRVLGMNAVSSATPLLLNMIIMAKDSSKNLVFVPVNKDGTFEDKGIFFYDTVRVYYSFNGNAKLTEVTQVQFDNGLLRQAPKVISYGERDPSGNWNDSLSRVRLNYFLAQQEALKKSMAATTLAEVIVKTKVKRDTHLQDMDKQYASGLFSGGDGYSFDLDDDPFAKGAMDVLGYLQGRVAGLMISGQGVNATLSWRGSTPDIFLNEMQADINQLQTLVVSDIAYIKVFRPPFFGSIGGGAGGAIAVYTKKGKSGRRASADAKGLENTVLGGYSRFKEFYSPTYDKPNENPETDIRTTLYWNPYILTDKKNPRYRIQFYNNDISKKLQVVLEGINADGKMTRVVSTLQ